MIPNYVFPLSSVSLGAAIETTVANIASPTELNNLGTTQGEIRLARTTEAGTGTQTWYYLDTTTDAESLPYIVGSVTAGLKWIAFGGRYVNEAVNVRGILTAASSLSVSSAATVTGLLTCSAGLSVTSAASVGGLLTCSSGLSVTSNTTHSGTTNCTGLLTCSSGLTVTSTTTLSALTASRLVRTDGSKQLESNAALTSTQILYADSSGWPTGDSNLTVTSTVFTIGSAKTVNFANTTSASSATVGAFTIGNGTAATNVAIGGGNINAGGTLTIGGTSSFTGNVGITAAPAANVTINSDKTYTTETSPVRGAQFIARLAVTADSSSAAYGGRFDAYATANFNYTTAVGLIGVYGRAQNVSVGAGKAVTGAAGGYFDIVNSPAGTITDAYTIKAGPASLAAGAITRLYGLYVDAVTVGGTNYAIYTNAGQVSINDTVDSTSITTGSVVTAGGIGVAKRLTLDGGTGKTIKYVNGTANAAVAVTFGAVGPTGSTAGNQVGWIRIDVGGTDRYVPYW